MKPFVRQTKTMWFAMIPEGLVNYGPRRSAQEAEEEALRDEQPHHKPQKQIQVVEIVPYDYGYPCDLTGNDAVCRLEAYYHSRGATLLHSQSSLTLSLQGAHKLRDILNKAIEKMEG